MVTRRPSLASSHNTHFFTKASYCSPFSSVVLEGKRSWLWGTHSYSGVKEELTPVT